MQLKHGLILQLVDIDPMIHETQTNINLQFVWLHIYHKTGIDIRVHFRDHSLSILIKQQNLSLIHKPNKLIISCNPVPPGPDTQGQMIGQGSQLNSEIYSGSAPADNCDIFQVTFLKLFYSGLTFKKENIYRIARRNKEYTHK